MRERIKQQWEIDQGETSPAIELLKSEIFQKVDIEIVECKVGTIPKWLDQCAGIDMIGKENGQLITIASRIQWDINYKTFTIRFQRTSGAKTEFGKRIEAIEKGYEYPIYQMQAYMNKEPLKLLDCALIKTNELYGFIKKNPGLIGERIANKEHNKFKYIRWIDLVNIESFWQYKSPSKQLTLLYNDETLI